MNEKQKTENFCALAYKAYKIDWMRRMDADRQTDELLTFYDEVLTGKYDENLPGESDGAYATFEEWVEDQGYDGELYVCMSEFLDEEFRDGEYMSELLRFRDRPDLEEAYGNALRFITENDILMKEI